MTADAGSPGPPAIRAVLDTSVLFSAHRHWLWLLAHLGYYEAVWSAFISGHATVIASLNTRDFPFGGAIASVRCVTPGTFLAEPEDCFPTDHLSLQARDAGRQLP